MQPFLLGIAGDSGAGKNTLTRGLVTALAASSVTPLSLDGYIRYNREERMRLGVTAVDPASNNLDLMIEHLKTLRSGGQVAMPVYDHRTGKLRESELVAATDLVIAYGLLTLATPDLAACFDLTIFLEPDEDLQKLWKRQRDVTERGYTPAQLDAEHDLRRRDAERFIKPQRSRADIVVHVFVCDPAAPHTDPANLGVTIIQRCAPQRPSLGEVLTTLFGTLPGDAHSLTLQSAVTDEDGCISDIVTCLPGNTAWFAHPLIPRLGLLSRLSPSSRSDTLAFAQLLLAQEIERITQPGQG